MPACSLQSLGDMLILATAHCSARQRKDSQLPFIDPFGWTTGKPTNLLRNFKVGRELLPKLQMLHPVQLSGFAGS
jgi:hypothetical protein